MIHILKQITSEQLQSLTDFFGFLLYKQLYDINFLQSVCIQISAKIVQNCEKMRLKMSLLYDLY